MDTRWSEIESKALADAALTPEDAAAVLACPDGAVLGLVDAARRVREKFFGRRVKLNYLVNVKSGLCPEDCHYCSQSKDSEAPIEKYPLMTPEEMIENAERGLAAGARRVCLVASGRGPGDREIGDFCTSVEKFKERHPEIEVCACLGLLKDGQAEKLKDAGVFAYNHNINTSRSHYEKICGTHGYGDRIDTVHKARAKGLSACSGVLSGMGESDADLVEMAFELRAQNVESIPVNFLIPVPGTPLERRGELNPWRCLKILALFRLTNPSREIRIAGGRELNLGTLQPLGLMIANSIFIGDYLTTKGQAARQDLEMIRDLGYVVEGQPADFLDTVLERPAVLFKDPVSTPA